MAIPQTKQFPAISMRGKSYLTVLIIIMLLGTMVAAFDAIARGIALPLIAADLHFSTFFAGLVISVSFLVTFLCNLVFGQLMDKWGRKTTFLITLLAIAFTSGFNA